jgi:hypothetical protein
MSREPQEPGKPGINAGSVEPQLVSHVGEITVQLDAGRSVRNRLYPYLVVASFLVGLASSYMVWGRREPQPVTVVQAPPVAQPSAAVNNGQSNAKLASIISAVNPEKGYALPIRYGDLGPRLIEEGVIDYDAFAAIYSNSGTPLSQEEMNVLQTGSSAPVVITAQNAHFLLNFFWAVGLANKNPILTDGPIVQNSEGQVDRFASTGGWGLASRPVTEIFASLDLMPLTAEQQKRVEEAAAAIYRPCCNNPTIFPDCNHGMAMLGILELMASQGATVDEMFAAAKYVNAFWFPQQTVETAIYLQASQGVEFKDADARLVVGRDFSSGSGYGQVHQALQAAGLLEQAPGSGNGCAN